MKIGLNGQFRGNGSAFGQLDVVVNYARAIVAGTAEETLDQDWNRLPSANLTGTFLVLRPVLPELRKPGAARS